MGESGAMGSNVDCCVGIEVGISVSTAGSFGISDGVGEAGVDSCVGG